MKTFRDLPIRTKLFVGFGVMIALILVISATAYFSVSVIQQKNQDIYEDDMANLHDALELRGMVADARENVLALIADPDPDATRQRMQTLQDDKNANTALMQDLLTRNQNDPVFLAKIQNFQSKRDVFVATRDNQVIPLIQEARLAGSGSLDQQAKLAEAVSISVGIQDERYDEITLILTDIVSYADQHAAGAIKESEQQAALMNTIIVIMFLISLVAGFGMAVTITRTTAGPLNELAQKANQIALGDLTIEIPPEAREDEIGVLTDSFRRMVAGLREVHTELSEGINVLASSSSEILATTTEIASGAAETAAAVSETTSTIEEVRQTSDLSSQKARVVADNAQRASAVAVSGQKAVDDVAGGMQRVQEQMESIAENVVQLAEKSQEIGEIIQTVNDISEQSNILAVNASIEAAKAGEEGKGFSVVAQEIRTLADQSKQATAQVRSILTDIQRGVSAAVMATEQGNRTVSEGMQQSNEAGESIRVLTKTISESAKAAAQIAASSQQQTVGISQIVQSMENIRQASQQNMTGTKQAEETAKVLHDLGQKLRQIAGRYRL
jgi:methyl-accepting chemotaxis protein